MATDGFRRHPIAPDAPNLLRLQQRPDRFAVQIARLTLNLFGAAAWRTSLVEPRHRHGPESVASTLATTSTAALALCEVLLCARRGYALEMRERIQSAVPRRYRYVVRGAIFAAISPFFVGRRVECPVCRRGARRWVSLGFPNRLCPHCSSADRQRLMILYLENELGIATKPLRMLHFAAEYCYFRHFRQMSNVAYIAADLDPPKGAVRMDITDIALDSDSVDLVLCSHVLEHVQEDLKAMQEMRRVLRPGGTALIMGPVDYDRESTYEDPTIMSPEARLAAFNQNDHVRIYGADFEDRLRQAGFEVEPSRYGRSLGDPTMRRYGLLGDEIIYVCS
jgi:Methyltransferase domain